MAEVGADGFALCPAVCNEEECARLREAIGPVAGAGRRGLLGIPEVRALAGDERFLALLRPHMPGEPFPVRSICFDKTPESNWPVLWHQDLTIAVTERREEAGPGPWSVKEGVPHVQPPAAFLEGMLTLRLHLDVADEGNGALRVLPGTHRWGRLTAAEIQVERERGMEQMCRAEVGDVLLMRPLLLHASGRSSREGHRRVLHLEYAATKPPAGLRWYETVRGAGRALI